MAAIIQLRRGSSPSSLSYGEIYVNDDSASLVLRLSGSGDIVTLTKLEQKNHGNLWIDGDITASSISASGDVRIGGQLFLGDEATDDIVVQGSLSSSLIPESNAAHDLGSSTKNWKDLYVGTIYATNTVLSGQSNISGSAQITAFGFISGSDLDSLNSYTSSTDIRLTNLQSTTSSFDVRITQLETDTGSQDQRLDRLELETGSLNTTNTAQNTRLTTLETKTGSLDSDITTINGRLGNVETTTASFDSRLDNLESTSGSSNTFQADATIQLNNIESTTSSFDGRLDNIESTTSSFDGRLDNLESTTASIDVRINGIDTTTASFDGRLDILEAKNTTIGTVTSSLDSRLDVQEAKSTTIGTVTSSFDGRLDNIESTTSSLDSRVDALETSTASSDISVDSLNTFTSSFNTAITLNSDDVTVLGNLTVQGTQTQLNTSTLNIEDKNLLIASGAADSSAANGAGITIDGADKTLTWDHSNSNFVFDARVSSSVGFAGDGSGLTGVTANAVAYSGITSKPTLISGSSQIDHDATTNFVAGEHFLQSDITTVGTIGTGVWQGTVIDKQYLDDEVLNTSLNSYTASNDTAATVQNNRLSNLESTTSSLDGRLDIQEAKSTTIAGVTSSLDSRLDNVETTTSSFDGRLDNIETTTSSFDGRLDRLQLETASLNTSVTTINSRLNNVESTTSSFDGRLDNLQATTESLDQRLDRIELYTSSNDTSSFNARFTNIESTTSSFDSRLDQLETNTGSLGTAAFFNVTSSIFGDSTVVPTAAAVNDAIVSAGGGDITAVGAGLGLSGGGVSGDVTINLDTGSTHFTQGVTAIAGGAVDLTSLNSYTASNDTKITNIHSTTASFDSRLDNLEGASGSYLTAHPNISAGSNISQDNSDGTVLQDLTITLDSNGHVTTATSATVNLDGRYYTETESDTLFTKKLGQGVISGSSQITSFGNLEINNPTVTGTLVSEDVIQFTGLSSTTETTAVMIDSSNELSKRTLGSNAFNSTTYLENLNGTGVFSGSSQIDHDATTNFVANEHIDHSSITIGSGKGLTGGGTIDVSRSLTLDTGSNHFDGGVSEKLTSLNSYTASNNVDITNLESFTSSVETAIALDSSNVTILGNLTVQGSTTELDVTTLNVADKNILIASGAADSAAADGAGITIDGANETLTWVHSDSRFQFSDDLHIVGNITVTGNVDGIDISAIDTDDVSEATNKYYTDARVKTKLDADGVISGSSQVNANSITNFDANVDTRLDAKTVISGSSQVDGASITNKSVSFGGVSVNLGSSDATPAFDLSDATAYPGDSSLTTLGTVTSGNVTAILPTGVISGSSQQTFLSSSFAETASLAIHTSEWTLTASGTNHYVFTGPGHLTGSSDPAIYLTRGQKYRFTNNSGGHPFRIQSTANGSAGTQYNNGVSNQDAGTGTTLTFDVPFNAPDTLYYQCTAHGNMGGPIYITNPTSYERVGSGIISGSSQVSLGGDLSGGANAATVEKVQGVSLTSAEATQLANIETTTISSAQWGYVGNLNQDLRTSDDVQFGKVGVGGASDATYELKVTGDIGATGDIVAYISSDKRLKDNIQPIEGALDKVSQISGNTFDWNEEKQNIYKGKDYGVIAQEIQEVMPELVDTRENGYLAVKYDKIVPLLIESIKELKKEIEELKSK